jgi:hypothetical protein
VQVHVVDRVRARGRAESSAACIAMRAPSPRDAARTCGSASHDSPVPRSAMESGTRPSGVRSSREERRASPIEMPSRAAS